MAYLLQHYAVNVFTIALAFLLLSGCAAYGPNPNLTHDPESPLSLSGIFPNTVQQGIATTIKVKIKNWREEMQLSLTPAGPFVSHQQSLGSPPLAIAGDGQYAYVATHSNQGEEGNNSSNLQIIHFPRAGQSKIIGTLPAINGKVTKLAYANKRLILALKHGGILLANVSKPALPVILFKFPTTSPVRDIQFDGATGYLLLEENILVKVDLNKDSQGVLLKSWRLPVPANAIAVRNNTLWSVGSEGVTTVKLTDKTAKLVSQTKTSGTAADIQLHNNLALIADGPGGLVVFTINDGGRLSWTGSYNKRGAINQFSITENGVIASLGNGTIMSIDLTNPELPSSGAVFKSARPILATANYNNAVDNKSVLLATANAVQLIHMTDNGMQAISPEGVNQGGSRRGVIRDNILYVADWFSGLHLYDISIPQQPRHLSNYHTPGSSKGVALFGHYALVGDDDQGLQIINVKNPLRPKWVSELAPKSLSTTGLAYTMKLVGNILYLADHRGGFHIIDLSDIKHPRRLGGYDTLGKSWGIDVFNDYVFVADDRSGLLVFDVSNYSKPKRVAQFDPGGQAEDVLIQDGHAYVTFFDKGLYILDILNPRQLKILGHTSIPGNARGIELADGLAYVAGWESGLHTVDIRNPKKPRLIGNFDTNGAAWGVNVKNGYAYVLDWWGGIKVIDVRQPTSPAYVNQYHARGTLQQLRTKNKYLYAASGAGGLQVFDIKNSLNPIWVTGVDLNGQAQDVWLEDDRAYVAAGDGGIVILDILDPFYTRRIGQFATPGNALRVRTWNDYLYIQDSRAGIIVVDVRNPQRPHEIARYPLFTNNLWVDDNAFWASTEQGLLWWTHRDNGTLSHKNQLTIPAGVNWVRSQDNLVVTANKDGNVKLWRKTPEGLVPLGQYHAHESISDLQLDGHTLYLMGKRSGLIAIDIRQPQTPRVTTLYPATGHHTRFEIAGGAAFFAGETSIASVNLLPTTPISVTRPGEIEIQLPAELPIGKYHLILTTPAGHRQLVPNALTVQFSKPYQKGSSLEALRNMLKTPLKSPADP